MLLSILLCFLLPNLFPGLPETWHNWNTTLAVIWSSLLGFLGLKQLALFLFTWKLGIQNSSTWLLFHFYAKKKKNWKLVWDFCFLLPLFFVIENLSCVKFTMLSLFWHFVFQFGHLAICFVSSSYWVPEHLGLLAVDSRQLGTSYWGIFSFQMSH